MALRVRGAPREKRGRGEQWSLSFTRILERFKKQECFIESRSGRIDGATAARALSVSLARSPAHVLYFECSGRMPGIPRSRK